MGKKARVLHYIRLKRIPGDKHFSLFGPIMSYEENEVLQIRDLESYSQHFIFFVTYKWAKKLECYITLGWKGVPGDKHFSLLGPVMSYKENEVNKGPGVIFTSLHFLCNVQLGIIS